MKIKINEYPINLPENILDIGSVVYFLWENLVIEKPIDAIRIDISEYDEHDIDDVSCESNHYITIIYIMEVDGKRVKVKSYNVFKSLKELKKSLVVDETYSV